MFEQQIAEITRQVAKQTAERIRREVIVELREELRALTGLKAYYTEAEAAEFLGLSKEQLQKYRIQGLINYVDHPVAADPYPEHLTDEPKRRRRSGIYGYTGSALIDYILRYEDVKNPRKIKLTDLLGLENGRER